MFSPHTTRAISVISQVDPRTIKRFLRGDATRPASASAIKDAMTQLGLEPQPLAVASTPEAR